MHDKLYLNEQIIVGQFYELLCGHRTGIAVWSDGRFSCRHLQTRLLAEWGFPGGINCHLCQIDILIYTVRETYSFGIKIGKTPKNSSQEPVFRCILASEVKSLSRV